MPKFLTDAQVSQYERDGYLAPLRVFSPEQAAQFRAELEAVEQAWGGPLTRPHTGKPHLLFPWAAELIRAPALLDAVEDLLGPDILAWESVLFIKEANTPSFISWHQDVTYWGLEPADILTAWVALSPSTPESGCMRVVPGSHTREVVPHIETYAPDNMLSRGQELSVEVKEEEAVDLVLQPGEMSLHNVRIFHGSLPNRSADRRIGLGIRYMSTATRQRSPLPDWACLVRGVDRFGHFRLEPVPERGGSLSPAAVAAHATARADRQALQASL